MNDGIKWWPRIVVTKFNDDTMQDLARFLDKDVRSINQIDLDRMVAEQSLSPDEVLVREGNAMVNGGTARVADLIIGESVNSFSGSNAGVGVGTGTTSTTSGMTDLQGTAYYQAVSSPSSSSGTISANSLFAAGDASFAWNEWCWFVSDGTITSGSSFSGVMLNRAVEDLGTKGTGAAWTLSASISIS